MCTETLYCTCKYTESLSCTLRYNLYCIGSFYFGSALWKLPMLSAYLGPGITQRHLKILRDSSKDPSQYLPPHPNFNNEETGPTKAMWSFLAGWSLCKTSYQGYWSQKLRGRLLGSPLRTSGQFFTTNLCSHLFLSSHIEWMSKLWPNPFASAWHPSSGGETPAGLE